MDLAIRVVAAADPVVPGIARLIADAYPVIGIASADALARAVTRLRETFDDPGTRRAVAERDGVATLRIGIADLSSLVVGSLALPPLLHHRLASVEPARTANAVAALFRADEPPTTATRF